MQNYQSQRSLAASLKVDSATVAKSASDLQLGTAGEHKNSARTFSPADAQKIAQMHFANREGACRNQMLGIDRDRLDNARSIGRLASMARMFNHPAAEAMEALHSLICRIDGGANPEKNALANQADRVKFLAKLNPHRAELSELLGRVSAKL